MRCQNKIYSCHICLDAVVGHDIPVFLLPVNMKSHFLNISILVYFSGTIANCSFNYLTTNNDHLITKIMIL